MKYLFLALSVAALLGAVILAETNDYHEARKQIITDQGTASIDCTVINCTFMPNNEPRFSRNKTGDE